MAGTKSNPIVVCDVDHFRTSDDPIPHYNISLKVRAQAESESFPGGMVALEAAVPGIKGSLSIKVDAADLAAAIARAMLNREDA